MGGRGDDPDRGGRREDEDGEGPGSPWRIGGEGGAEGDPGREEERLPRTEPPRGLSSEGVRAVSRRYTTWVGVAFVVLVVVAIVNGIGTDEVGLLGDDERVGGPLVEFAVPDAVDGPEGDANIAQDDCETGAVPCPPDSVRTPACEVEVESALRVCDFFDRPLAISFWFTRGGDCLPTQDAFDRVAQRFGDRVNFLSINVRDDRERVREIIAEHGWEVAVGHDADGAVSNLYGVGVCPSITLAAPGGILVDSEIAAGNLDEAEIARLIEELLETSRARARGERGGDG